MLIKKDITKRRSALKTAGGIVGDFQKSCVFRPEKKTPTKYLNVLAENKVFALQKAGV